MQRLVLQIALVLTLVSIAPLTARSQGQNQADTPKPSFEVATVKPALPPFTDSVARRLPGGRFEAINTSLRALISYAYRVRFDQISGGPQWLKSENWNIEAKAADGTVPTPTGPPNMNVPDVYAFMLQSLLEGRFQLQMHNETKDLPAYDLVVTKSGVKMKLAQDQTPAQLAYLGAGPLPRPGDSLARGTVVGYGSIRGATLEGSAVSLPDIVRELSGEVGRAVVDKTELTGFYDFKLEYIPVGAGPSMGSDSAESEDPTKLSIFTALQEQLGLKLESTKAPGKLLVIDHVEKPSEN